MAWGDNKSQVGPGTDCDSLARLLEKHDLKIIRQRFSLKPGLKIYATHAGAH
jgi:hypothetical protein